MATERTGHWRFLRGLVRESAHWDDFSQRFALAIPDARAQLIGLPGNGWHWRLPSPLSIGKMTKCARQQALSPPPSA